MLNPASTATHHTFIVIPFSIYKQCTCIVQHISMYHHEQSIVGTSIAQHVSAIDPS